jgi:hypothetical protein
MFGFLFGTACLVGLIAVARGGRRHYYGGGCHPGGRYGRGPLHAVFSRLDTAPGQEKVLREVARELEDQLRASGKTLLDSRREVAEAFRQERLDEDRVQAGFGQQDQAFAEMRSAILDALRKVHETLDERQRRTLSDLIESGPRFGFFGHRRGYC